MTSFQERRNKAARKHYHKWRTTALSAYGGKCGRCGFADPRALQFDHVNGGGVRERKTFRGNGRGSYYKRVYEQVGSGKYQLLCANCNWIKRAVNHEERGPTI